MNADRLTAPQRQALAVLVAAQCRAEPRPCRASNRTSKLYELTRREMVTVQHDVADQLVTVGLARFTNDVLRTLELTPEGRALAQETGL